MSLYIPTRTRGKNSRPHCAYSADLSQQELWVSPDGEVFVTNKQVRRMAIRHSDRYIHSE